MRQAMKVAWRYLFSSPLQSALLVFGVAVGVVVFIFMSALIGGLAVFLVERTVGDIPHVTLEELPRDPAALINGPGVLTAVQRSNTQREQIRPWASVVDVVSDTPGVSRVAPEITGAGFLLRGQTIAPVSLIGLEPDKVSAIADIEGKLVSGSADLTVDSILMGRTLAEKLGLRVGQTVRLRSDRGRERTVTVSGIFSLGVESLDERVLYINIRAARALLDLPSGVSRIEVKIDQVRDAPAVAARLAAATGLKATPWTEKNAQLLDALVAQGRSGDLIKTFALITILIGITSAMLLTTYRRRPEIGIMRAMGARRGFILQVFVFQGLMIGAAGGALGALLGFLMLSPFPPAAQAGPGDLPVDAGQGGYLLAFALTVLASAVASILPARAAARVDPVSVIGQ